MTFGRILPIGSLYRNIFEMMRSLIQRFALALSAWEACIVLYFLGVFALIPGHSWRKTDVVWLAQLAICGLFVVGIVALLSQRLGKIGATIVGLLCGLLPSVLLLAYVLVLRPGFEASAGTAGIAELLAVPSGVGGALAGIICARRKN
jgi:hypothetical protein